MGFSNFTLIVLLLAAWFVLNRWVLPWFGVPTCMSGSCSMVSPPSAIERADQSPADKAD